MLHHRKAPSTSLEEDLKGIGIAGDADDIHGLATKTVEEVILNVGVAGHGRGTSLVEDEDEDGGGDGDGDQIDEDDPIDGKYVTRELLARIINLPLDHMEESDFDELLDALKEKELPEDDEELRQLAEAVVQELLEVKLKRVRKAEGGYARKAPAGYKMVGGKPVKIKVGERLTKKRKRKKYMRGRGQVVTKRRMRGRGKRRAARLARRKMIGEQPGELAMELSSLVSESVMGEKFASTVDRLAVIFDLIDETLADDDVGKILDETWTNFEAQITEDMEEEAFLEAVRPCLIVIKRCLEEFELADRMEAEKDSEKKKKKSKGNNNNDDDDDDEDEDDQEEDYPT